MYIEFNIIHFSCCCLTHTHTHTRLFPTDCIIGFTALNTCSSLKMAVVCSQIL